jgi:hypothetical protein
VDPQWKKAVWWGVADEVLTDKWDKDLSMVRQRISKMFKKYPPTAKNDARAFRKAHHQKYQRQFVSQI